MISEVIIPKLGLTMTEATLREWKAGEGDGVEVEQPILLIETEKISYEVPAPAAGLLHITVGEGAVVPVGKLVALIAGSREEYQQVCREAPLEQLVVEAESTSAPLGERVKVSPLARKLAEERGVDITRVVGTGPGGRIVREDVLRAAEQGRVAVEEPFKRVKETIPLWGMRKAIAEHMHRSLQVAAQLTRWSEVEMTELIKLRQALNAQGEGLGVHITFTDIFVKLVAEALKQHPILNSSLIGEEIRVWEDINIGVAVALEDEAGGLIVPVVHNADQKSLLEISRTLSGLVEGARERKLLPDDVAGGTFTITNQGAFAAGGDFDTPIINQPQVAILGTYGIVDKPVARGGEVVVRPMMTCSLTHDHRVVDGVPAGRFLATLRGLMENPPPLALE